MDEKVGSFERHVNSYLVQHFPKVLEGFDNKGKQFQINDTSGHVIEGSPFTTFSLKKIYEIRIHKDKDNDDVYFILWMQKSFLFFSISFHFGNLIQRTNEIVVHDIENGQVEGQGTFCLLEYPIKFKTHNGLIFMFKTDKHVHCTIKNQMGDQYGLAFFQKTSIMNFLKALK